MARVFFAWELGGGLGHLLRLKPLMEGLVSAGHEVTLSARHLGQVSSIYKGIRLKFLQAPFHSGRSQNPVEPSTLADIMHNTGFSDPQELQALVDSWRLQISEVRPNLIVVDHSPTALLASRAYPVKRVVAGNGFSCPAKGGFPNWRPESQNDSQCLKQREAAVLAVINEVMITLGEPPLTHLFELFDVDDCILTTFQELDAVPNRLQVTKYCGSWQCSTGKQPVWPDLPGPRVFAYLKPSNILPHLFRELFKRRLPTIVYAGGLDRRFADAFRAPHIRFEFDLLDIEAIGKDCSLAILNATQGSVIDFLLAGIPQLLLPLYLEQRVTAERVVELGAGLMGPTNAASGVAELIDTLLTQPSFRDAAKAFAVKYSQYDARKAADAATERLLQLLS